MLFSGALIGGLRALSHLAHGYCPTGGGKSVGLVDTGTGGLCSMITGAVDSVVAKVHDSFSGFDNTASGILGYSVFGHQWVSDPTALFSGGTIKGGVSSMYRTSGGVFFVNDVPVSVNGRIVFGFTDLVLYTVSNDLVNDSMPATTTDVIVAPNFDLVLWEDAHACMVPDKWFITKDIIALPVYEIAAWPRVLSDNAVPVWEDPRVDSLAVLLDSVPLLAEVASASWAKNVAGHLSAVTRLVRQAPHGTLGMWSVSLAVRALTVAFGLGLSLLVVGTMLWSTLTTSWYNTGLGNLVSLVLLKVFILALNHSSPIRSATLLEAPASVKPFPVAGDDCDPWDGILDLYLDPEGEEMEASFATDLDQLSDEELERQIAELKREMEMHDANIAKLEFGMKLLDAEDAMLGQVEDRLAAAERIADNILDTLADPRWEDVGDGEGEVG